MESLLSNWVGFNPWVEQSFTNIYKDRMRCNCKAWYPHHDSKEYVLNLWLSEGAGGTAFYTWNNYAQGIHLPEHAKIKFLVSKFVVHMSMKSLLVMKTGGCITLNLYNITVLSSIMETIFTQHICRNTHMSMISGTL
ncbi:MAG: hypothetical protein CM15mV10_1820 [uncultured marine virus]|nr:MAG: hypothetical protein CM15mV10_1820 [uncultured marine virus]